MSYYDNLRAACDQGKLSAKDADFARSMLGSFDRRGSFSDAQFKWVNTLLRRAAGDPSAQALSANVGQVFALFARAKGRGLKFPKIRLQLADGSPVVLAQAGERSRYCGEVQITDGGRFGSNRYFGRIDQNGYLHASSDMVPAVQQLVADLAAAPEVVASIHGHRTGECCFCGLQLTDGRSVAVGYGPVCADKFGLAWGERSIDTEVTVRAEAVAA